MTSFRKNFPSWLWGVVLILVAVGALVVVGWLGFRNLQKSVWNEARADCEEWADRLDTELRADRLDRLEGRRVVLSTEFPEPGSFDFDPTAGEEQLRAWREERGLSRGGIPMQLLAGLALLKMDPTEEAAHDLATEAVSSAPSFLTPRLLAEIATLCEEADLPFEQEFFQDAWQRDERARTMIRAEERAGFHADHGEIFWMKPQLDNLWEVSGPEEISTVLNAHRDNEKLAHLRWMGVALKVENGVCGNAGQVLVRKVIPGGVLELGLIDQELLESHSREQLHWITLMVGLAVLAVGAGLWVMMLGVFKERKMAYAKSQFVASVTHELRAPVGSMRLMADALESGKVRPKKVAEFHRLMARESGRLSVLIENVMDLAKVEDGGRVLRVEELDLEELVTEVCEMMALPARENGVTLKPSGPKIKISADPVALRQILVNLIDNALKFSPDGGAVTVSWEASDAGWWLTVSDEGPGVPVAIQERIFERFFRGEEELRRTTKGVGIGLGLVKDLVDLHGGTVRVTNDGGAVFRIEFSKS